MPSTGVTPSITVPPCTPTTSSPRCSTLSATYYYQLENTYVIETSPVNFANGLSFDLLGTIFGSSGQTVCALSPFNVEAETCAAWTDYDTAVTFPTTSSGNPPNTRWETPASEVVSFRYTSPGTATVSYTEQFLLTMAVVLTSGETVVSASPPASTTTPAVGQTWEGSGSSVSLFTRDPSVTTGGVTYYFDDWTGTGTGSYSGSTVAPSITMKGPITETSNYANAFDFKISESPASGSVLTTGSVTTTVTVTSLSLLH